MRAALTALLLFVLASPAWSADITGRARVIDGDTIEIDRQRIRLFGIDAPEGDQGCSLEGELWDCGRSAAAELMGMTVGHDVTCRQRDRDRYDRIVAVCFVDGIDINRAMVRLGWALAYRQFSTDYVYAELEAKMERRGVWQGIVIPPWEWRRLAKSQR